MEKFLSLISGVLAKELNMDPSEFAEKVKTDDGLAEIEGNIKELNIFSPSNLTARDDRVKTNHIDELTEKVGTNEVPTQLYNAIKGNVIEQTDKDIARKFEIESFTDHNDLIGKIQEKKADVKINEKLKSDYDEAVAKIEELNGQLSEKESKFSEFTKTQKLQSAKNEFIKNYPYAVKTDEDKVKQKKVLESLIDKDFKLDIIEDQVVLLDDQGKPKKDPKTLKLIDPFETMKTELAGYVQQDNGATGGTGNGAPQDQGAATQTMDQFKEEMSGKGINELSYEYNQEYSKRVKEGIIETKED